MATSTSATVEAVEANSERTRASSSSRSETSSAQAVGMAKPSTSKPLKAAARPRRFLPSRRGRAARGEEVADINPPYKWQNLPRHYRELFTFGTPVTKFPLVPPVTAVTSGTVLTPCDYR